MKNFTISNIVGGDVKQCRKLSVAAKYIATHPRYGGYKIVNCHPADRADIEAVLTWAESAAREQHGRRDWEKVAEMCIKWVSC